MENRDNFKNQIIFLAAILCFYRLHAPAEGIFAAGVIITGAVVMTGFPLLFTRLSLPLFGAAVSLTLLNAGIWIALSAWFPTCFYPEESLTVGIGSFLFYLILSKSSERKKLCAVFGAFSLLYGLLFCIPGWYLFRYFSGYLVLCAAAFFFREMVLQKRGGKEESGSETKQTAKRASFMVPGLVAAALIVAAAEQIVNSWW